MKRALRFKRRTRINYELVTVGNDLRLPNGEYVWAPYQYRPNVFTSYASGYMSLLKFPMRG